MSLEKLLIFGGIGADSKDGLNIVEMRFCKIKDSTDAKKTNQDKVKS
jgi:hypothetical protein